jgi:hypothetical protein
MAIVISRQEAINLSVPLFIVEWNNKYPYDRWWRSKYNIPFGSNQHKETNFISMKIEYQEDLLFQKIKKEIEDNSEESLSEKEVDRMIGSSSEATINGKKIVKMSNKEVDNEFDDLNLDDFDDKKV